MYFKPIFFFNLKFDRFFKYLSAAIRSIVRCTRPLTHRPWPFKLALLSTSDLLRKGCPSPQNTNCHRFCVNDMHSYDAITVSIIRFFFFALLFLAKWNTMRSLLLKSYNIPNDRGRGESTVSKILTFMHWISVLLSVFQNFWIFY